MMNAAKSRKAQADDEAPPIIAEMFVELLEKNPDAVPEYRRDELMRALATSLLSADMRHHVLRVDAAMLRNIAAAPHASDWSLLRQICDRVARSEDGEPQYDD
jgi:hypothetical protein